MFIFFILNILNKYYIKYNVYIFYVKGKLPQ